MAATSHKRQHCQRVFLEDKPITAKKVKPLNRLRTVHLLEIEPCPSCPDLPDEIVVKQMKEGWEEEFGQEITAYTRLSDLQGTVIPEFLGEGSFDGHSTLFLSKVEGSTLNDLALSESTVDEEALKVQLVRAIRELHDRGAEYWDPRLDNFLVCDDGKVTIVDLEQIEFPEKCRKWEESVNLGNVGYLVDRFRQARGRNSASSSGAFDGYFGTSGPSQLTDREMGWDPTTLLPRM